MNVLKRVAAQLPERWQAELKRIRFGRQIKRGAFKSDEPEYRLLHELVMAGDWVIDVGANVGHYTQRLSDLVGPHGRVLAFEPVPATFSLLAANVQRFTHSNVSLINAAVSDRLDIANISMPRFESGLTNYYEAQLKPQAECALSVLTMPLDALGVDHRIALVKIDTEGHESLVLSGMKRLLERSHPVLIIETRSAEVSADLTSLGYAAARLPDSPNILFRYGL